MNPIITKDLIIRDSRFEDIDTFYTWECTPEVKELFLSLMSEGLYEAD